MTRARRNGVSQIQLLFQSRKQTNFTQNNTFIFIYFALFEDILHIRDEIKKHQKIKSETILEGIETQSTSVLNKVYTELYIVTCDSTSINKEHEVWQAETAHLKDYSEASVIKCQDLFKPAEAETIRCVMTKGIAGIGKTVAAQKLNLDWADGKES
jgi:hypothetical protein